LLSFLCLVGFFPSFVPHTGFGPPRFGSRCVRRRAGVSSPQGLDALGNVAVTRPFFFRTDRYPLKGTLAELDPIDFLAHQRPCHRNRIRIQVLVPFLRCSFIFFGFARFRSIHYLDQVCLLFDGPRGRSRARVFPYPPAHLTAFLLSFDLLTLSLFKKLAHLPSSLRLFTYFWKFSLAVVDCVAIAGFVPLCNLYAALPVF